MSHDKPPKVLSRRGLVAAMGGASAIAAMGGFGDVLPARAASVFGPVNAENRLKLHNIHNGEKIDTVFRTPEGYVAEGLREVEHFLRDFRTGDVHAMDRGLLDLVHALHERFDTDRPFEVISGYRSPKTNAMLAGRSNGVGKKSYHMRGMAMDISLPGHDIRDLHGAAKAMKRGGVGLYARTNFIHVDTGPVRYW